VGVNSGGTGLTLTTNTAGLTKYITLSAATNGTTGGVDTTLADLGLSAGKQSGTGYTAAQVASAINTAVQNAEQATDPSTLAGGTLYNPNKWTPGTKDAVVASVNTSGQLVITNSQAGLDHSISTLTEATAAATPVFGAVNAAMAAVPTPASTAPSAIWRTPSTWRSRTTPR
jgi:hypothetical protein